MYPSRDQQLYLDQVYDLYFGRLSATAAKMIEKRRKASIDGRLNSMFFERDTVQEIRNAWRHRRWAA
eukprot:10156166-Karenia_brevis.AAC.1